MESIQHQHVRDACGTTIAWSEVGKGYPLVLLHGIQDSNRTWRRVAPLLADRFWVILPDLPGFGDSGRPDGAYTLSWYGDLLTAWLQEIGVHRAHFCGHSFGGGIAQWMVLEHRSLVDRLALVSAGGLGRSVGLALRLAAFPGLGPALSPLVLRHVVPVALRCWPEAYGNMEPEEVERFLAWSRIPGTERAFQRSVRGVINLLGQYMQTVDRIGDVQSPPPTALFWGDKDPIIPIRHARRILQRSDGVTLTEYEGCGHFPQLEASERFALDLLDFLTDPARPGATMHAPPRWDMPWLWRALAALPAMHAISAEGQRACAEHRAEQHPSVTRVRGG